jgi:hypothetical protein
VALSGIAIVGVAAWFMTRRQASVGEVTAYVLEVRVGLGHDVESVLGPALAAHVRSRRLVSIATAKQGMAIEVNYRTELHTEQSAGELVKALNLVEGVQSVSLTRVPTEE